MNPNALPIELRAFPQWVCWTIKRRNGKRTKVPVDPSTGSFASTADPDTWGTFEVVLDHARSPGIQGIGFVFTDSDSYVGVDVDDCRDPETGELSEEAVGIVTRLHSYTEVSPSETGLHVIARGRLPDGQRRRGSVEMYDTGRFFTMTGERLQATPETVCDRPGALRIVHKRYVAPPSARQGIDSEATTETGQESSRTLEDDDLLRKAKTADNGGKFQRLWNGNTSGYDSHSEADMALCCLLAFWTGREDSRIDHLFRQSRLMRPKWDEVHYADGATYGERTVERACRRVTEAYSAG